MRFSNILLGGAALIFAATSAWADGPKGFGAIKIGMTKAAVQALKVKDGYYLNSPLKPVKMEGAVDGSLEPYETVITGSALYEPIDTILTFKDGTLNNIHMRFPEHSAQFNRLRSQAMYKYGRSFHIHVSSDWSSQSKKCKLKNGKTVYVGNGIISDAWRATTNNPTQVIQTTFSESNHLGCDEATLERRTSLMSHTIDINTIDNPRGGIDPIEMDLDEAL